MNLIARRTKNSSNQITFPDIQEGGFAWTRTETSTMFYAIAYDPVLEVLRVVFRKSGRTVEYSNFSARRWFYFYNARSLGRHWTNYISNLEGTEVQNDY